MLFETVRFPVTRPRVVVTEANGTFRDVATKDLQLMGDDYPFYTAKGGVECYVVEARARGRLAAPTMTRSASSTGLTSMRSPLTHRDIRPRCPPVLCVYVQELPIVHHHSS